MTYRIDSDDQDQEIRDLTNRVAELEKQLAEAQKPDVSANTLPIHVVIARFLKEQATKYKTEQNNIVVGLMQDDLYVWDFDGGRAMQDQWQTKKIINEPLNGL